MRMRCICASMWQPTASAQLRQHFWSHSSLRGLPGACTCCYSYAACHASAALRYAAVERGCFHSRCAASDASTACGIAASCCEGGLQAGLLHTWRAWQPVAPSAAALLRLAMRPPRPVRSPAPHPGRQAGLAGLRSLPCRAAVFRLPPSPALSVIGAGVCSTQLRSDPAVQQQRRQRRLAAVAHSTSVSGDAAASDPWT